MIMVDRRLAVLDNKWMLTLPVKKRDDYYAKLDGLKDY